MKPCVSPFSMARPTRVIGRLATSSGRPRGPRLGLGHPDAAERRIDVERVGRNAVADPPVLAVEQVGRDDLEIVVGGMRERAAAVAVAQRPDPRHVGRQAIVDDDVAARIGGDAGPVQPRSSVFGRRPTASSTWEPMASPGSSAQSTRTAMS